MSLALTRGEGVIVGVGGLGAKMNGFLLGPAQTPLHGPCTESVEVSMLDVKLLVDLHMFLPVTAPRSPERSLASKLGFQGWGCH